MRGVALFCNVISLFLYLWGVLGLRAVASWDFLSAKFCVWPPGVVGERSWGLLRAAGGFPEPCDQILVCLLLSTVIIFLQAVATHTARVERQMHC